MCLYGELQTQTSEHVSEATETLHCSLKNVDFAGSFGLVVGVCKKSRLFNQRISILDFSGEKICEIVRVLKKISFIHEFEFEFLLDSARQGGCSRRRNL